MRKAQFKKIAVEIKNKFPEFIISGADMHLKVENHILRSIIFESSSSKDGFYLNHCIQFLCVPNEYIYFQFGGRQAYFSDPAQPPPAEWALEVTEQFAIPFLHKHRTIESFLDFIGEPYPMEEPKWYDRGFLLASIGRLQEATECLNRARHVQTTQLQWSSGGRKEPTLTLLQKIQEGQDAVNRQLAEWENYTRSKLKLPASLFD
jgi:hypothetical protein